MKNKITAILCILSIVFLSGVGMPISAEGEDVIKYDDVITFDGFTIKEIKNITVNSTKVGFGESPSEKDESVLTAIDENSARATGVGSARVTLVDEFKNETQRTVSVEKARISMILLIGQSNAEGTTYNNAANSQYRQSIKIESGQAYSTYAPSGASPENYYTKQALENYLGLSEGNGKSGEYFTASALGGAKSGISNAGEPLEYPIDTLTDGDGKSGVDSAIAFEWVKQTGEKVWVVNAAHQGTSITKWDSDNENSELLQAKSVMDSAVDTMEREIKGGHYEFNALSYVWIQGESDGAMSAEEYTNRFVKLHSFLCENVKIDTDSDGEKDKSIQKCGLVAARVCDSGVNNHLVKDIYMNGQRLSHYNMAALSTGVFKDIIMACNIGDSWTQTYRNQEPAALGEWFNEHYEGVYPEVVFDYETHGDAPKVPLSAHDVLYQFHYSQCCYNEVGREVSRNLLCAMGLMQSTAQGKIKVLSEKGYEEFADGDILPVNDATGKSDNISITSTPAFSGLEFDFGTTGGAYENGYITAQSSGKLTLTEPNTGIEFVLNLKVTKYGDANGDGIVNIKDTLTIIKYRADDSTPIDLYAADVLKSGKITMTDILKLQKYLAKYDNIVLGSTNALN